MKKKQTGFTLIELIMVIVILGILAAFALPRFADLSGDANTAKIDGLLGGVKSANSIAHSACLTDSTCDTSADNQTIDLDGAQNVDIDYGYPGADSDTTGIADALDASGYTLLTSTDTDGNTDDGNGDLNSTNEVGIIFTNEPATSADDDGVACVYYIESVGNGSAIGDGTFTYVDGAADTCA